MILKIITVGDGAELLRQKSNPVDPNMISYLQDLIHDMSQTMFKHNGLGLSAIQVGKPIQLFLSSVNGKTKTYINPSITTKSQYKTEFKEGCLSIPNVFVKMRRSQSILASYLDDKGEEHKDELITGMEARVFQHEFDHIQGILISDFQKLEKI